MIHRPIAIFDRLKFNHTLCVEIHVRVRGGAKVGKGSKYDGKAADIFSAGVCLFTMLAGFSPLDIDEAKVRENWRKKYNSGRITSEEVEAVVVEPPHIVRVF